MANIARTRMSFRPISRVGVMDWVTAPLVALLAMSWPKRLACIGGTALALMGAISLASHAFNGWSFHLWGSGRLPMSAAERAPLFTAAWVSHDEKAMKRFVLAADQPKLNAWATANPVPTPVTSIPPTDRTIKTVSVQKDDLDGAILKVRISDESVAGGDSKDGAFTQHQVWTYSGGNWYFSPETPPAIAEQKVAIGAHGPHGNSARSRTARAGEFRRNGTSDTIAGVEKRHHPDDRPAVAADSLKSAVA